MRLIDADELIYDLEIVPLTGDGGVDINDLEDIIKRQPPIEERKTGRWIWDDEGYHCSECFFHAYGNTLECFDGTYRYCPNCGAKMDGKDGNDD